MPNIDIIALGVGAGATAVYEGAPSSAFLLRVDNQPVLLLDVVSSLSCSSPTEQTQTWLTVVNNTLFCACTSQHLQPLGVTGWSADCESTRHTLTHVLMLSNCCPLQGVGVVREALNVAGQLPDSVYISHNHTDHAGERGWGLWGWGSGLIHFSAQL